MLKYILFAVIVVLALLFFCKTRVELIYLDGAVTVKARLLYIFKLTLYPFKKRPKKVKKQGKKKKDKPREPPPEKKPKQTAPIPIMDYIQTLNDMLPIMGRSMGYWLRHTTINRLWVRTVVHEEDAADTAIRCGQLSAAAQALYACVTPLIRIKDFSFNAVPNYRDGGQPLNLCLWVSASPAGMMWGMVLFLCRGGRALWRGPLVSQMMKKQPKADHSTNKRQARKKTEFKQIKDGVR